MPVEMRITLRLPLAVHTALSKEAKESGTSLNTLIVERLNASVGNPYRGGEEASVSDRVDTLESDIINLRNRLEKLEKAKK